MLTGCGKNGAFLVILVADATGFAIGWACRAVRGGAACRGGLEQGAVSCLREECRARHTADFSYSW